MNNSLAHAVEFEDGDVREHSTNVIAENMMCRVGADSHVFMALQAIINHRKDNTACDLKDDKNKISIMR